MVAVVPSGSKRTMARPPEQQPKRRPWASWARPLVRLVPSRQVVIWSVRGAMRRMRLGGDVGEQQLLAVPDRPLGHPAEGFGQ